MAFTFNESEASERIRLLTAGLMRNIKDDDSTGSIDSMSHISSLLGSGLALLDNPTPRNQSKREDDPTDGVDSADDSNLDENMDEEIAETDHDFTEPGLLKYLRTLRPNIVSHSRWTTPKYLTTSILTMDR